MGEDPVGSAHSGPPPDGEFAAPAATPYDGLMELSQECWRCYALTAYRAAGQVPLIPIVGNAPDVFSDIRNFLNNLLSFFNWWNIVNWWQSYGLPILGGRIYDSLVRPLQNFFAGFRDAVGGFFNALRNTLNESLYNIWDQITGHLIQLRDAWYNGVSWLQNAIGGFMANLRDNLNSSLYYLRDQITGHLVQLKDAFNNRLWALQAAFGGFIADIRDRIDLGLAALRAILQNPLAAIEEGLEWFKTTWLGNMIAAAWSMLTNFWSMVVLDVAMSMQRVLPKAIELAQTAVATATPIVSALWEGFESIPSAYLTWLSATCGTDLALTPSRALGSVGGLYGISIVAGTAAMAISTALDLVPTLNWVGASQLAGYVSQVAAFGPLTSAAYGTLINDAISVPLRYHWNNQLRPVLPGDGDIHNLERQRAIEQSVGHQVEAYHGLPDYWIDIIDQYIWRQPTLRNLMQASEGAIPRLTDPGAKAGWLARNLPNWRTDPMAWVKMKLMLGGFEDMDIGPLVEAVRARALKPSMTILQTPVRAMLHNAYWTEANANATLGPVGMRPEEVHMLVVAEELDYQRTFLDDQVAYYKESFRKDLIDEHDLSLALSTIYVKPERVAQEIARERVRKLPKPKPVAQPKEDPNVTRLRGQAVDSWLKQYRAWAISEDDLLLGLTIVLQDPALAQKLVSIEVTRFRPQPAIPKPAPEDPVVAASRRQAIATWVTAFRDGTISAGELETYLAPLVTDAATRTQLVQLEQLRYKPTPDLLPATGEDPALSKVRAEYVRGHIDLFQKRLLNVEQLYQDLQADGLIEALARATVITQAATRLRVPSTNSVYWQMDFLSELLAAGQQGYEDDYMTGAIGLDQYKAWLLTLVQDQDVVTYLADTLELRRFTGGL